MAFLNDRVQCWAQYCFCCISLTLELVHSFGSNADICRYIVDTSELIFCQTNVSCKHVLLQCSSECVYSVGWWMSSTRLKQWRAYLGFHKGGRNFRWPVVLTQRGGQKQAKISYFFLWWKKFVVAKGGPWPNGPLNTPLSSSLTHQKQNWSVSQSRKHLSFVMDDIQWPWPNAPL